MPTVREYFYADQYTLTIHKDMTVRGGGASAAIVSRCHIDFVAGVRYVSYLMPMMADFFEVASLLIDHPEVALNLAVDEAQVSLSHPQLDERPINGHMLPFSHRIFLYVEGSISPEDRSRLYEYADLRSVLLTVRDVRYAEERTSLEHPQAFISHDSRDKDDVARPLANKLRDMLCPVWYDEFSLTVGDSLRESIDRGLRDSKKCIIILSPNFLANPGWTKGEFNAIINRHFNEGGSVLLPVWHNLTREEVARYSSLVTDIIALDSRIGIEELAVQLFRKIRT